jgi:hypothetical protein
MLYNTHSAKRCNCATCGAVFGYIELAWAGDKPNKPTMCGPCAAYGAINLYPNDNKHWALWRWPEVKVILLREENEWCYVAVQENTAEGVGWEKWTWFENEYFYATDVVDTDLLTVKRVLNSFCDLSGEQPKQVGRVEDLDYRTYPQFYSLHFALVEAKRTVGNDCPVGLRNGKSFKTKFLLPGDIVRNNLDEWDRIISIEKV